MKIGRKTVEELLRLNIKSLFYGNKTILRDLELSVSRGERILIVGPTGAGKSSLLKTLNLMNLSYEGSISLAGKDLREHEPEVLRSRICLVMQEPFLEPGTVQEALDAPLHYHALHHRDLSGRDHRVKNLFKSFQLDPELLDQNSEKLSGGEKQRVALIRALQLNPEVLLLDEISSALDQKTSAVISDCVFNNYPGTVIAISHDPLWQDRWQRVWALEGGILKDSVRGRQ